MPTLEVPGPPPLVVLVSGWDYVMRQVSQIYAKELSEICNSLQLGDGRWLRSVGESSGHDWKAVDDLVLRRGCWDGTVGMPKFHCVRYDLALGVAFDELKATI